MVSEQDIVGVCIFCEHNVDFFESHVSAPGYGKCWHWTCEVREFSKPDSTWYNFEAQQVLECLEFLENTGYSSLAEWALDSDYEYNQELGIWLDEYSNPVRIAQNLFFAMEQALYVGEEG